MGAACGRDAPISYEVHLLLEAPPLVACCAGTAKVVPESLPTESQRCTADVFEGSPSTEEGRPPNSSELPGRPPDGSELPGRAPEASKDVAAEAEPEAVSPDSVHMAVPASAELPVARGAAAATEAPLLPRRQPANPSSAFVAFLSFLEGAGAMGMSVDVTAFGYLRINTVEDEGPIAAYNSAAPERARIQEGDFIVSVNGKEGDAQMQFLAIQAGGLIELEIIRPLCFFVCGLDLTCSTLGLDVVYHETSTAAYIIGIREGGLINAYNVAHPDQQVRDGDLVVAVNGQTGSAGDLLRWMAATDDIGSLDDPCLLELTIARPWAL